MDQTLRILMLGDFAADAQLIQSELDKAGIDHVTHRVETNRDFLNALKEFVPDVILAENHLPQFSGLQALRLLQAQDSDLPFILITDAESEDAAVECLRQGADDYILKSSLGRLPSALLDALKKKAAASDQQKAEIRKLAAFPRCNPNPVLSFEAGGSLSYFNEATLQMAKALGERAPDRDSSPGRGLQIS